MNTCGYDGQMPASAYLVDVHHASSEARNVGLRLDQTVNVLW